MTDSWDGNGWHTPDVPPVGHTSETERLSAPAGPNVRLPLNGAQEKENGNE